MHAADAAGSEDLDAGHGSNDHRGGDCGGAVLAPGDEYGQVAARGLGHSLSFVAQILNFFGGATSLEFAADDSDGGGCSTIVTDGLLDTQCRFHILGIRHAVGDDGGFKGDHGAALVECLLHFG